MERFDVRRGIIKEVGENGGLSELAKELFEKVERTSAESFEGSHGVMRLQGTIPNRGETRRRNGPRRLQRPNRPFRQHDISWRCLIAFLQTR